MPAGLDVDEQVLWGAGPEGWLLGWRDLSIGLLDVAVVATGVRYALTGLGILVGLEEVGLSERSWTWVFFSSAMLLTAGLILGVGGDNVYAGRRRRRQQEAGQQQPTIPGTSIGTFYEGLLTVGYTTDEADDAVQADILAAGYGR